MVTIQLLEKIKKRLCKVATASAIFAVKMGVLGNLGLLGVMGFMGVMGIPVLNFPKA